MAIIMSSFLVPISPALPYLVEDKMIRGGFRCLDTIEERDKLHPMAKKPGMLVWCAVPGQMFQLAADKVTWAPANFGGSSGGDGGEVEVPKLEVEFESPLISSVNAQGQTVVGMSAQNKIPAAPSPGMSLVSGPNDSLMWLDLTGGAQSGQRVVKTFELPSYLMPGSNYDFTMELAKTSLLLQVELNAFDIRVEGHETGHYSDPNPYTFVSSIGRMSDVGIREDDGVLTRERRYSILSNREGRTSHFFRVQNVGTVPAKPTLTITYLVLE